MTDETTTPSEPTEDQMREASAAIEAALRDQAVAVLNSALPHFQENFGMSEGEALEEIALQAFSRSFLLYGMMPEASQEALKDLPLLVAPPARQSQ